MKGIEDLYSELSKIKNKHCYYYAIEGNMDKGELHDDDNCPVCNNSHLINSIAEEYASIFHKHMSEADVVRQSEQLKAEGRKEATEEIRQWLIDRDYEGLAESL